ncbi:hypothetical protein [Ralstonia pseudosolanacearum]|uniref:hypothetical protein n=1 Tax=Ralstonia pseudosolanacearum TaxID=1310165 RepID=UPI001866211B|nr:hypothetical protein [Ralstonia pseudosolanacearum]QOK91524.1 hypothetical protein HF908_08555 [Ralstonia pseudosolanacearum]UWD89724.1 hypothetical protein NY025_18735 [Ralstonia pseudosolanacearum]
MDVGTKPVQKEPVGRVSKRNSQRKPAQERSQTQEQAAIAAGAEQRQLDHKSNPARHRRFRRYLRVAYKAIQGNFSLVASVTALAFGGLTLLMYAWSIGQLPEFTWNDLTGTLLAVCATGVLVVVLVVAYCLSAGYFARSALEAVYPEAAQHLALEQASADLSSEPYARLIRGPFILGATCFSVLAWVGLLVALSAERLVSPHNEHLLFALFGALVAVAILVLVDWKRFDSQWVRYALLSVLSGTIVALVVIITAWSVGPTSLVTKILSKASGHAGTVDWSSYWVAALDHVIGIGMSVAIGVAALLNLGTIMSLVGRGLRWIVDLIPWTWPEWLSQAVTKTSHVVVGDAPDRRLIRAKVYVTFWFCLFTSAVLFMADAMAAMGDARDWSLNFFFIATLLTVLNWASFSVRQWKGRAGLGLVTAALVFLSYPMVARNPIMFPKIVVTLLGLGNERLASIGLSSKQCATLAPYGVNCAADNERGFTLTDVNLLSRLGGSIVLELLVTTGALEREASSAGTTAMRPQSDGKIPQAVRTLVATRQMELSSSTAGNCDKLLVSKLQSSDAVNAKTLRCVVLVVPKDQMLGYTKAGTRTYRGEYTAYDPPRAKAPAVVRIISGEAEVADKRTELLVGGMVK